MNNRPIRFVHRGHVVELADAPVTRSVLDWLRGDARRCGTKEGCAEGDCGACTVALGSLDAAGAVQLQTVNACIQFLPMLDGKALFTVEDLSPHPGPLHPVQQALVDGHASQCGFCTPGFVMSLWSCWERHQARGTRPTRQQLADELSGNLCRCTGYRAILDAGEQLFDGGEARARRLDRPALAVTLRRLAADPPLHWPGRYHGPRTLSAFAALRERLPQALVLAGATDVGLWVTKRLQDLPELISVGQVPELQAIAVADGELQIGAAASLEAAWSALAGHWPQLQQVGLRFASPPVRHAGTIGGNLANGSPIGDSAPVLMALDARIVLQRRDTTRELPLHDFYTGYLRNRLEPGEFVRGVRVPLPRSDVALRAYKVGKRFDSDISAVCGALAVQLDAGVVRSARLAYGGMAATVRRAAHAESALLGQPWTPATVDAAMAALGSDFEPLSDLRASAGYRMQVARNLLRRFWLQTCGDAALPPGAVSVWTREAAA